MVTKSPKARVLGRRRWKNINPRVHVQKLDENLIRVYRDRLARPSCNPSNSIKEERTCFFTSEIDLNENEHVSHAREQNGPCMCGYCSPYYEMKMRAHQDYLNALEDQENVDQQYQYLRNVVQESATSPYPYVCELINESNGYVPPVALEKYDAETQTDPRQYRFTCRDCGSQFNIEHYYEQHILVHRNQYECPYCNACFPNEKQLQPHVLLHMSKNFFECAYCNCVYPSKKLLIKHISCHDKIMYECGACRAKFATDKCLQIHKKSHDSSGKLIHVFRLAKVGALQRRQPPQMPQPVEQQAQAQLPTVEVEFVETFPAANEALSRVPSSNAAGHFYECDACHLCFPNERLLLRHSIIHKRKAAIYLHFCNVCGARFRANNHLVFHMRSAHPANA